MQNNKHIYLNILKDHTHVAWFSSVDTASSLISLLWTQFHKV